MEAILKTDLPETVHSKGKVRDTYILGDKLLMVTTDRLSAFDVIFDQPIPWKGIVLNELSLFWFDFTKDIIGNHLIGDPKGDYAYLKRRAMLVKRTEPMQLECVVRGYLAGSGWKEYSKNGTVCGIHLPEGFTQSQKLPQPIFTPSTKATIGHDLNITESQASDIVGNEVYETIKKASLSIYMSASEYALEKGIIIADTKFEFGICGGDTILIDEVLTPDSSRFWPKSEYSPGKPQPSFDKQYVRDYVEELGWDKKPPAPTLPDNIIKGTSERYIEAYEMITGKKFRR
ncbi:MAG: phosphoribosylaminoimidazolesuccinocarboxamide synthase [Candidatus Micrarchaeota archaeon]